MNDPFTQTDRFGMKVSDIPAKAGHEVKPSGAFYKVKPSDWIPAPGSTSGHASLV